MRGMMKGTRADVVEVAVGDDDGAHFVLALLDVFRVRQDVVDAGGVLVLELEADVDDDDVVAAFDHGAVLADLLDAAEGDDADGVRRERRDELGFFRLALIGIFCERRRRRAPSTASAAKTAAGTVRPAGIPAERLGNGTRGRSRCGAC